MARDEDGWRRLVGGQYRKSAPERKGAIAHVTGVDEWSVFLTGVQDPVIGETFYATRDRFDLDWHPFPRTELEWRALVGTRFRKTIGHAAGVEARLTHVGGYLALEGMKGSVEYTATREDFDLEWEPAPDPQQ